MDTKILHLGVLLLLLLLGNYLKKQIPGPIKSPALICDLSAFSVPAIHGMTLLSLSASAQNNYSKPPLAVFPPITNLKFCEVTIHLTHEGANDDVLVHVWLLLDRAAWNGRLQVTGGGGFATSMGFVGRAPALQQGYAAVSTDGGHDEFSWTSLDWLLNATRTVKWELWENFMHRSVVEQIVVAKGIVEQYYTEKPHYSYWNGCSQGGRQGVYVGPETSPSAGWHHGCCTGSGSCFHLHGRVLASARHERGWDLYVELRV
jgi:hypothetical protein